MSEVPLQEFQALASAAAYKGTVLIKTAPPQDPTVGLCLGPYGGPRGGAVYYDRGTFVSTLERVRFVPSGGWKSHLDECL